MAELKTALNTKAGLPPIRDKLYPGEDEFFRKNPHVAGMAADDDKVIINPYSPLSWDEKAAVAYNERARIVMRKSSERPAFDLTPEQAKRFGAYSPNQQDVRETVAARILSGDPSAGEPTKEQAAYVERLRKMMHGDD